MASPRILSHIAPDAFLEIASDAVKFRPNQAIKAMRIISIWSITEAAFTNIICQCVNSDFEIVASILNDLVSANARQTAISHAVKHAHQTDLALYTAICSVIKPSRDLRNALAHHIWMYTRSIPDAICLVDPKHMASVMARYASADKLNPDTTFTNDTPSPEIDRSKVMVYTDEILDAEIAEAEYCERIVNQLLMVLAGCGALSDEIRETLMQDQRIQSKIQSQSGKKKQ